MNKKFTKLIAALALLVFMTPTMVGWGQTTWSHEFASGDSYSNNSFTVAEATWEVSTATPVGSPTISFGNMQKKYALKFGSSGSNYFPTITLATDYFTNYNVQSVTVNICNNGSKEGTLTVIQGNTTIGTTSQTFGQTWTDLTASTNIGSGGTLSVSYSVAQACGIHSISVTYTGGSTATPTTVTIDASSITNTDVYTSTTAGSLSATVKDNDNNVISGATVSWESSDENVATIDANGIVTLVAAGTTTITASYDGVANQYQASSDDYELVVTSSAPYVQPNPVVINMNYIWLGSTNGGNLSASQLPVENVDDNVTTIIAKGTSSTNPRGDLDYIRLYNGSTLTFDAPEGYVMTSIEFTTGGNNTWNAPSVSTGTLSSKTWTGNAESVVFTMTGSCFISKATITLATPASLHTLTATMSHVAEFYVYVGDNIDPIVFDDNNQAQVAEGATVGVSIAAMEDCFVFGSLTVNSSSAGVTQEDPNDPYFTFEMPGGDATIDVISSAAAQYTLTVGTLEHVTLELTAGEDSEPVQLTGNSADLCVGIHVTVIATAAQGYTSPTLSVVDGNNQPIEVINEGDNTFSFVMPAGNVTITATAEEVVPEGTIVFGNKGTKINSANVTGNDDLGNTWTITTEGTTSFTQNTNYSQVGKAAEPATSITFSTTLPQTVNITTFSAMFGGFSDTAGNVTLKVGETTVGSGTLNGTNDVTVSNTSTATGTVLTVTVTDIAKGVKCYSISYTYEVISTPGYTLSITAHTTTGGWNLIASPVAVNPANVTGMTDGNFDLYRFNGNPTPVDNVTKEWENWKQTGDHYHFDLVPGKGYLYANAATVDLIFSGTMATTLADVDLPYDGESEVKSLYLAGNSLQQATTFFVYGGDELEKQTVNFLTLNGNGDGFVTTQTNAFTAQAMQGFFVQNGGEGWFMSTFDLDAKSGTPELLNIMVNQNRGTLVDNAIVSFSDAPMMNKFYLNDNSTRVYIPQNGEEMAVVRSETQGEMPVNFRANENGTYTLSIDAENVEMNYLHLIDNMTGMDIDLLQTPSYTFEANTRDYESRFRLVFAGASTGSATDDNFAFFSNGNLIINNDGNATLQVIDLTGRILSSESVNGSVSTTLNATPGVYMLRLINGENVKVQKIVVR